MNVNNEFLHEETLTLIEERVYIALLQYLRNTEIRLEYPYPNSDYIHYATQVPETFVFGGILSNLRRKDFLSMIDEGDSKVNFFLRKTTDSPIVTLSPNAIKVYYFLRYLFQSNLILYSDGFPIQVSSISKGTKLQEDETETILKELQLKRIVSKRDDNWYIDDIPSFRNFPKGENTDTRTFSETRQVPQVAEETVTISDDRTNNVLSEFLKISKELKDVVKEQTLVIKDLQETIKSQSDEIQKLKDSIETYQTSKRMRFTGSKELERLFRQEPMSTDNTVDDLPW